MNKFLDTIDKIRKYNQGLPTKQNGYSLVKFGEGIKSFEKQLGDGEVFEHYLVELINEKTDFKAIKIWANGTPTFLSTVLSVKSLCILEIGNFSAKWYKSAFATPKFPSAFSKSIGFTL